jgi:hypothetical protein
LIVLWTERERTHERAHMANVGEVAAFLGAWVTSLGKEQG